MGHIWRTSCYINEYPYSNFQELNLDWILGLMRAFQDDLDYVKSFFDEIDKKIDDKIAAATSELEERINKQLKENVEQVTKLVEDVTEQMTMLNNRFTILEDTHKKDILRLEEEISKIKVQVPDYQNPESGIYEDLQTIINFLYFQTFNTWITAGEFDSLNLTAQAFDAHNFTAGIFDRSAKAILIPNRTSEEV